MEVVSTQANNQASLNPELGDRESFVNQVRQFALDMKSRGVLIASDNERSITKLYSIPDQKFEAIQAQFSKFAGLFSGLDLPTNEKIEGPNEKQLLEVCARRLGVVFSDDIYNRMEDGDVIEVYNQDFVQIYRNLGFFNLCSYNLLDLLTNEFFELYQRSLFVNSMIFEKCGILAARPYSLEPVSLENIPSHLMREQFSDEKCSFQISFREMYPIYTWSKEFYGYLVLQGAKKFVGSLDGITFI